MHAEMSALLDAGRRGVPVQGATLYTTTFPCHNCARHIVGAGIDRVVCRALHQEPRRAPTCRLDRYRARNSGRWQGQLCPIRRRRAASVQRDVRCRCPRRARAPRS
ncbi:MAG: deaminase [Chloroflexia bacterium]